MANGLLPEGSQPTKDYVTEGIMKALIVAAREFARDEEGITAIEYGLIAAVIAGVVATAFGLLGTDLQAAFTTIGNKMKAAASAT